MSSTIPGMNQQVVPDPTQMRRYLEQGLTQAQIVEQWEEDSGARVSRSAIGMAIGRYGLKSARPRERYMDTIPWKLNPEHQASPEARLLRFEARRRRGLELAERERVWLNGWLAELADDGKVVMYDPRTVEGFWYVARTDEDDDPVIRRPKED